MERTLWININPNSFFSTPKICHIKFDPVFDPNSDIMLCIEGIKYCRISCDPVHLPNLPTARLIVAYTSIGGMQRGNTAKGGVLRMSYGE